jgi:sulfotransferase
MSGRTHLHFIAGLPRSGSTLLSAILRQNPAIHAAMSSPVEHIFSSTLLSMSGRNQFARFISDTQRERILRTIFDAYYTDISNGWIFDTNRNWPSRLPALMRLFPDAKIICCVRDLVAVVNSFEHLVAANPFTVSRMFGWDAHKTVYSRFERLMAPDGSIGRSLNALREGHSSVYGDRLHFVEYDDLATNPREVISSIYEAVGLPAFEHKFNSVSYQEQGFDQDLNLRTMHTVRPMVAPLVRPLILPEDLVARLRGKEFWRHG